MARRSHKGGRKRSDKATPFLIGGGVAVVLVLGLLFVLFPGLSDSFGGGASGRNGRDANLRIADYRVNASRLTGNTYRLTGCVENIDTVGNERMVAVSLPNNQQERLPLLVPSSLSSGVNLTRGDTFIFEVECRTGRDERNREVKGVLVVRNIESK